MLGGLLDFWGFPGGVALGVRKVECDSINFRNVSIIPDPTRFFLSGQKFLPSRPRGRAGAAIRPTPPGP